MIADDRKLTFSNIPTTPYHEVPGGPVLPSSPTPYNTSALIAEPYSTSRPIHQFGRQENISEGLIATTSYSRQTEMTLTEKPRPNRLSSWIWNFEIALLALGICSFMVSIVLLAVQNGTLLGSWRGYFSLNTIISVLGTISRSSLASAVGSCIAQQKWNWFYKRHDELYGFDRFDAASRGPLGSIQLLFWLKKINWVALGPAIVIILLGFEPFIQAIVTQIGQFDTIENLSDALIGASFNLDVGTLGWGPGVWFGIPTKNGTVYMYARGWSAFPDLAMVSSVYNGFNSLNLSTHSIPAFTCRTGNCTWEPFASLAICSSCNDVTDQLTISSKESEKNCNEGYCIEGSTTTFSLPYVSITNFDTVKSTSQVGKRTDSSYPITNMQASGVVDGWRTVSFVNNTSLILAFGVINADEAYLNSEIPWALSHPKATECALYICTKVYKSLVSNGEFTEQELASFNIRDSGSFMPSEGDLAISGGTDEDAAKAYDAFVGNSSLFRAPFARYDLRLLIPGEDAARYNLISDGSPIKFNISERTLKSTIGWTDLTWDGQQLRWYKNPESTYINGSFSTQSPVATSLTEASALPDVFARVARSMTLWIRNHAFETQPPRRGTALVWALHVRIRWEFLALPLAALLGACVFCTTTMLETSSIGLRPWKESCLAIFAHGINEETRLRLVNAEEYRDKSDSIEAEGRRICVGLINSIDGIMLEAKPN